MLCGCGRRNCELACQKRRFTQSSLGARDPRGADRGGSGFLVRTAHPGYNRCMAKSELGKFSLERMDRAVETVRDRLLRATAALERAGISYAVIGGHAVAAWVSRVDPLLARYTRDVDIV